MLIRTEFNQMNDLQFRNGFYAYSPKYLQDQLSGPLLALIKVTLSVEAHWSLQSQVKMRCRGFTERRL